MTLAKKKSSKKKSSKKRSSSKKMREPSDLGIDTNDDRDLNVDLLDKIGGNVNKKESDEQGSFNIILDEDEDNLDEDSKEKEDMLLEQMGDKLLDQNILKKIKDDLELLQKKLNIESEELKLRERSLERSLRELREEEEELRGKSKIDKVLFLIKRIKNSVRAVNSLEKELKSEGEDISKYSALKKKIIRQEGDYEFYVDDAKQCQQWINDALKWLNMVKRNWEEGKNKELPFFEEQSYYKSRGLLKALHFRMNIFDNHIHSVKSKPIELMRIFSALEPTVTSLSSLDEDIESFGADKLQKSFEDLSLEDKIDFMKVNFTHDYVPKLSRNVKNNSFVVLLQNIIFAPEQVLDQMKKWERNHPLNREKLVKYLQTFLTSTERMTIAEKDIDELKRKGVINIS
jgi:hypothetical protein